LSSKPYINEITTLKAILEENQKTSFAEFSALPLCQNSDNLINLVNYTSLPLIDEFREIQYFWVDFDYHWKTNIRDLTSMVNETNGLVNGFYDLRNVE